MTVLVLRTWPSLVLFSCVLYMTRLPLFLFRGVRNASSRMSKPVVYMDISIGGSPAGRIVFEVSCRWCQITAVPVRGTTQWICVWVVVPALFSLPFVRRLALLASPVSYFSSCAPTWFRKQPVSDGPSRLCSVFPFVCVCVHLLFAVAY